MSSPVLSHLATHFERYLTLHRVHPSRTYNYKARNFFDLPLIEFTRHRPKCASGESWVYVATPASANIAQLANDEKLYIGAQTQDRMFRGDNLDGENFHHAEMRAGKGADNLVSFLKTSGEVVVSRISGDAIYSAVARVPELHVLHTLMRQPLPPRAHRAWWLEQYVLNCELPSWRWNTRGATNFVSVFLASQR